MLSKLNSAKRPALLHLHQPPAWRKWPEATEAVDVFLLADTARTVAKMARTIWSKPAVLGSGRTGLPFMPLSMTFWLSRHSRRISACTLFQVMLPALAFLLTGCIGVLPLPQLSNQPTHGTKLRAKDTAFIRVGTTSASELFGTLGTDCLCDPRQRAVAFSWELPGGRGVWWGCSTVGGGAAEFEWSRWRGLFVAFDDNNVVTAANSKHLSSSKSLHEQLEAWARKHHAASDHIHPEMFVAKNP